MHFRIGTLIGREASNGIGINHTTLSAVVRAKLPTPPLAHRIGEGICALVDVGIPVENASPVPTEDD